MLSSFALAQVRFTFEVRDAPPDADVREAKLQVKAAVAARSADACRGQGTANMGNGWDQRKRWCCGHRRVLAAARTRPVLTIGIVGRVDRFPTFRLALQGLHRNSYKGRGLDQGGQASGLGSRPVGSPGAFPSLGWTLMALSTGLTPWKTAQSGQLAPGWSGPWPLDSGQSGRRGLWRPRSAAVPKGGTL